MWNARQLDKIPPMPEHLSHLVRVRVIGGFCIKGQAVPIGAQVEIPFHLAQDLRAIGKIHLLVD